MIGIVRFLITMMCSMELIMGVVVRSRLGSRRGSIIVVVSLLVILLRMLEVVRSSVCCTLFMVAFFSCKYIYSDGKSMF
jgi:hypothetical protein